MSFTDTRVHWSKSLSAIVRGLYSFVFRPVVYVGSTIGITLYQWHFATIVLATLVAIEYYRVNKAIWASESDVVANIHHILVATVAPIIIVMPALQIFSPNQMTVLSVGAFTVVVGIILFHIPFYINSIAQDHLVFDASEYQEMNTPQLTDQGTTNHFASTINDQTEYCIPNQDSILLQIPTPSSYLFSVYGTKEELITELLSTDSERVSRSSMCPRCRRVDTTIRRSNMPWKEVQVRSVAFSKKVAKLESGNPICDSCREEIVTQLFEDPDAPISEEEVIATKI